MLLHQDQHHQYTNRRPTMLNKFLASLTVSLPPVIALVLIDPSDVLGIYDPWIAGALGFVLATAAYMTGKNSAQADADRKVNFALLEKNTSEENYKSLA